ncbi:hypothetical protein [Streptomyces sp. NPDC048057]|uniref:hypothetical protein n=1 Tax=Streptomyces sp. NPDC048057 TaxID=3155628 RepID=UPI0033E88D48
MRKKYVITGVAIAAVVAGGGVYYAAGGPPFGKDGTVSADQVCSDLGPADAAARTLNKLLPASESYSVDSKKNVRVQDGDGFSSSCFVSGDGKQLLSLVAELRNGESLDEWVDHVSVGTDYLPKEETKKFGPGGRGMVSRKAASILVPCASEKQDPGMPRDLGVSLRLREGTRMEGGDAIRGAARELVTAAAKQAHEKAKCDVPLELS